MINPHDRDPLIMDGDPKQEKERHTCFTALDFSLTFLLKEKVERK